MMGNNPNKDSIRQSNKTMKNGGCGCGCIQTNSSNHVDPFKYKKGSIIPNKKNNNPKKNIKLRYNPISKKKY